MAFNHFKSVRQVAGAFQLRSITDSLFPSPTIPDAPEWLEEYLALSRKWRKTDAGESYYREFMIAPVLHAVMRAHEFLNIWAGDYALQAGGDLAGTPDYLITGLPYLQGYDAPGQTPFLAVAEAKRENFTEGWGQCLAEMHACQKINGDLDLTIWGIVTTGETWQFGKLEGEIYTRHASSVDLDPLGKLLAVLHYIFKQCDDAARKAAGVG